MRAQPCTAQHKLGSFYCVVRGCSYVTAQLRLNALRARQSTIEAGSLILHRAGLWVLYGATAFKCAHSPPEYNRSWVAYIALRGAVASFKRGYAMLRPLAKFLKAHNLPPHDDPHSPLTLKNFAFSIHGYRSGICMTSDVTKTKHTEPQ